MMLMKDMSKLDDDSEVVVFVSDCKPLVVLMLFYYWHLKTWSLSFSGFLLLHRPITILIK